MARKVWRWVIGLGGGLLLAGGVLAQVSPTFNLSWHLLSASGGSRTSASYQLDDSVGQPVGQPSSSAGFEIAPGFWYGVGEAASPWLDGYEVDDTCLTANPIATNGSVQTHTFHDSADEDWVKFNAQAGKTYVIQVANVGDSVDAVVMLYNLCDQAPLEADDNAFGPTVQLEWNCLAAGEYYVAVVQHDPSVYGPGTNYDLSVRVDAVPPVAPRSIRVDPADRALNVQWNPSVEPDVAGYGLRWGTTSGGPYSFAPVDGAGNTYYHLGSLNNGQPYYLVLTALDFSGNESSYSVEVGGVPAFTQDNTFPAVAVSWPTASPVYSTTAAMLTVGGAASDSGNNLSHVLVHNTTNDARGWEYNLSGGSASFMVESIPLVLGNNQLQVTAYDAAGNTGTASLTIHRLGNLGGAVVIAGGHDSTHSLQTNIDYTTNRAYRVFRNAGFGPDQIYYLSPGPQDADGDGASDVDATITPANLHTALQWAAGEVGPGVPFYLYLMDHGAREGFCADGCTLDGRVSSEALDGWLGELEATSDCDLVTVIVDACHSGSFIDRVDGVAQSISRDGRVVIASTGRDNNAYASAQGAYFSDAFFSAVAESSSLLAAFDHARAAVDLAGASQTPWLDDNGDALYSAADGAYAASRYVATYFGSLLPEITAASLSLGTTGGSIQATVDQGDALLDVVWAAIYPPSFQVPAETTLSLGVPLIELEPDPAQPGRYSAYYNAFTEAGDYRIVVYAEDRAGNQALPYVVAAGEMRHIYLPLVLRADNP
jgi:hypothetical protein